MSADGLIRYVHDCTDVQAHEQPFMVYLHDYNNAGSAFSWRAAVLLSHSRLSQEPWPPDKQTELALLFLIIINSGVSYMELILTFWTHLLHGQAWMSFYSIVKGTLGNAPFPSVPLNAANEFVYPLPFIHRCMSRVILSKKYFFYTKKTLPFIYHEYWLIAIQKYAPLFWSKKKNRSIIQLSQTKCPRHYRLLKKRTTRDQWPQEDADY